MNNYNGSSMKYSEFTVHCVHYMHPHLYAIEQYRDLVKQLFYAKFSLLPCLLAHSTVKKHLTV